MKTWKLSCESNVGHTQLFAVPSDGGESRLLLQFAGNYRHYKIAEECRLAGLPLAETDDPDVDESASMPGELPWNMDHVRAAVALAGTEPAKV